MNLIEEISVRLDAITKAPRKYREFFGLMTMSVITKNSNITIISNQRDGTKKEIVYDDSWIKELADMFAVMDYADESYSLDKFIKKIELKKYQLTIIPAEILDEVISSIKKGEVPHVK